MRATKKKTPPAAAGSDPAAHAEPPADTDTGTGAGPELQLIRVDRIDPSPMNPRRSFDEDALARLAESIRTQGVLEPLIVRPLDCRVVPRYQLVCADDGRSGDVAATAGRRPWLICRHCQRCPVNRPRGLCWDCYYTPGVRELYPSTSKYARRGVGNFCGNAPLPEEPTTAPPGTPDKLEVLETRARLGQSLFHPEDAA